VSQLITVLSQFQFSDNREEGRRGEHSERTVALGQMNRELTSIA
jgi:hypothetical protein